MIRERLGLDGQWQFCFTGDDRAPPGSASPWRVAVVPGPWQGQFEDLRMSRGVAWYRRSFRVPAGWRRDRVFLHFGAVSYHAQVQINGHLIGEHEGGWLPFACEAGPHLRYGDSNELTVRVILPADCTERYPEFPFTEIPFGKQSWYGPLGGLWQSVALERRSALHIAALRVFPQPDQGRVAARIALESAPAHGMELSVTVERPGGSLVAQGTVPVPAGTTEVEAALAVPRLRLWSPESPTLYRLSVALRDPAGEESDRVSKSFGFRTIETRDGRLYLNGAPIYLRGALDQDYYPDGICTPPSLEFLEDQLLKAKQLGLNCLRCHIKVPDPRYYDVADRLGMLIWSELPNSERVTEPSRVRAEHTLRGIVERDGHHPSIICWTIINENWGTDLVHDPEHRAWLKRTYDWLKAFDPDRLVVDNSPLAPSLHVKTDLEDYHYYAAIPDHRGDWDRFLEVFAARPDWTFSPHGDAERTGTEPLLVSEFGTWGLPDPALLAGADGREPWWFETGHDWTDGVMVGHGIERRFGDLHLDRVFGSLRGLVEAAQWQQFLGLKYQIEAIRRQPALAGYVLTEFTDCHWECNGLLDMRRNPRVFHEVFATINADTVVVPDWRRLAWWEGETATFGATVAHGAGGPLTGATLEVRLDGAGAESSVPVVSSGNTATLPEFSLPVPVRGRSRTMPLLFTLRAATGETLAENRVELAIHARRDHRADTGPVTWSTDPALRERMAALGYPIARTMAEAALLIGTGLDPAVTAFVRAGGSFLLLADRPMALEPLFPHWQNVRVQVRDGTVWRGDWASSFSWVRRAGPFAALPGGPLTDHAFDRVIPRHVITGCTRLDFEARVHAGLMVGWVHRPVALAVERPYGAGRLVATTFRLLEDAPGVDPTATVLLDGLIALAAAARDRAAVLEDTLTLAQRVA